MAKKEVKNGKKPILGILIIILLCGAVAYQQYEIYRLQQAQTKLQDDFVKTAEQLKKVYVYDFNQNEHQGMSEEERGYWRDVGTIDAYYNANMELLGYSPIFNLYSKDWPIKTFNYNYPPAKFIWQEDGRTGMAANSMVSEGCIISGSTLSHCVLSPNVRVNSYSTITDSIIMEDVSIGRHCEIKKAIIDKNVEIPPCTKIGLNKDDDLARGFFISPEGVTVVPKGAKF